MSMIEVKVPDIGDFKEVEVIELLVKVGDTIKADQSLITVESDKASMEIPASHAGVIKELKVKIGDKVAECFSAGSSSGYSSCCTCRWHCRYTCACGGIRPGRSTRPSTSGRELQRPGRHRM
jgi:hypothetical protein